MFSSFTPASTENFTYDRIGNIKEFVATSGGVTTLDQQRTYTPANEIDTINLPPSVTQPVYDPNGNMTTLPSPGDWITGYTCKWDAWNRLVAVNPGTSPLGTYVYDAMHRRITTTNVAGTRQLYYDRRWRVVEERDASTSNVLTQYLWSPIDRWTLLRRNLFSGGVVSQTRWCLKDNLDPVAIIDGSGTVQGRFAYDAFGATTFMNASFGTSGTPTISTWNFLFHAEFEDVETNLYNYGYRYYHSSLGRWLSRDPSGEMNGVNLYAFVENNTPNFKDHLGLEPLVPSDSTKTPTGMVTMADLAKIAAGAVAGGLVSTITANMLGRSCSTVDAIDCGTIEFPVKCTQHCSSHHFYSFCSDPGGHGFRHACMQCQGWIDLTWEFYSWKDSGHDCDADKCGCNCKDDGITYSDEILTR